MPDFSPDPRTVEDLAAVDAALGGRRVDPERRSLADLAVLLREERPAPDEPAAQRLDERFAAALRDAHGSTSTAGRRRALRSALTGGRWTWWPALAAVACVLLAAVVVLGELRGAGSGLVSSNTDGAGSATADEDVEREVLPESERSAPAADSAAGASADPVRPIVPGGTPSDPTDARERRLVERSAFLTLTTKPGELADVASRIVRTTDDVGGYVASSTVGEHAGRRGGASFELRVPARELPRTLAALSRLARVTERSESTRDVTADAGRAARRIAELRAERRGLLRALERSGSVREAARIRARLRAVARRTAAARAASGRLRSRAAFATVAVELVADGDAGAAVGDGRWTPGDAVRTAVRVLEVAVGVALVAAALALPLAIIAAAFVAATRLVARRRARALDAG